MKVLELFAGLGGCAEALREVPGVEVVAAIDHDEAAHRTYTANFDHPAHRLNLASVSFDRLASFEADAWWLSPPCQPFTVRGRRRDVDDPRCAALLHLLDAIQALRPSRIALENVPGFAGSIAHVRLVAVLRGAGYGFADVQRCPTELGIPGERRRFYLLAEREGDAKIEPPTPVARRLADYLDAEADEDLFVPEDIVRRYADGLAVVDADDDDAVAYCFTAAYGRSWVYGGSYLREGGRVRRFSPREILRLLGFSGAFTAPEGRLAKRYKLVGNSLSVDVVRGLLQTAWSR